MKEKFGIGIDIVNISRFEKISIVSKADFYRKIFLPSEIKYCIKFKKNSEHFAGKFAIKEAVKKSISEKVDFLNIKTSHFKSKPIVEIINNKKYSFIVSLSHESNFAIAIVISVKKIVCPSFK